MTAAEQNAMFDTCFDYDDHLRANGHWAGRRRAPACGNSVRVRNGRRVVTDGPFAETREQLGGYYLVEARNLDEVIDIAGRIPGARKGTVEIRPVLEIPGLPAD